MPARKGVRAKLGRGKVGSAKRKIIKSGGGARALKTYKSLSKTSKQAMSLRAKSRGTTITQELRGVAKSRAPERPPMPAAPRTRSKGKAKPLPRVRTPARGPMPTGPLPGRGMPRRPLNEQAPDRPGKGGGKIRRAILAANPGGLTRGVLRKKVRATKKARRATR